MSGYPLSTPHQAITAPAPVTKELLTQRASRYDTLAEHRLIFPSIVFIIHTALVILAAVLANAYATPSSSRELTKSRLGYQLPAGHDQLPSFVYPFTRWDGIWYAFASQMPNLDLGRDFERFGSPSDTLWPALPWVMRLGHQLTGSPPELVGLLFVNLCFAGALIAVYALVADLFGIPIARRTLWCLALIPVSFFYHMLYTEAPFLLFAALCLLASRKGWWPLAGIAALLAALTRSHGVILLFPMAVLFMQQVRPLRWRQRAMAPLLLLPLLAPVIDLQVSGTTNTRYLIDFRAQQSLLQVQKPPWQAIACAIRGCEYQMQVYGNTMGQWAPGARWHWVVQLVEHPSLTLISSLAWRREVALSGSLGLVATLGVLVLTAIGLFKLPLWLNAYAIPLVLMALIRMPALAPFDMMPRFALILFPLAIVLAMLLEDTLTRILLGSVSLIVMVGLTMQFANWYWVS